MNNNTQIIQQIHTMPPIKETLQTYLIQAKKSLAQNFILDLSINEKIANLVPLNSTKTILEIGPGPGGLTRMLIARIMQSNSQAKLIAIEPDTQCLNALQPLQQISQQRLILQQGFAEKQNLPNLLPKEKNSTAVVANLPYNVGSVILMKLLSQIKLFNSMTLMFQEEVAQRICATPQNKDYSRLSVVVQFLCECKIVMNLPRQAFTPTPKVDSAVVQLLPLGDSVVRLSSWESLQEISKAAFSSRRKMLRSSLRSLVSASDELLSVADIDGSRRAETLSIDEFDRLSYYYERDFRDAL